MVQPPVEKRDRGGGRQELALLAERPVAGDVETSALIGRRDKAKEQLGAHLVQRREGKLVDDDQVGGSNHR